MQPSSRRSVEQRIKTQLSSSTDDPELKSIAGMKGMYVRPSRAIEKGGGFFVPGLEGERIRIVSAVLLLMLYAINLVGTNAAEFSISTAAGLFVTVLLLLQGVVDLFPSDSALSKDSRIDPMKDVLSGIQYSPELNPSIISSLSILSRTIVQTCEKVNYILVASGFAPSAPGKQ